MSFNLQLIADGVQNWGTTARANTQKIIDALTGAAPIGPLDVDGDIDIQGDIYISGNVDGVDIAALKSQVDAFPAQLQNLTDEEIQQLENIGDTTISADQWSYLGAATGPLGSAPYRIPSGQSFLTASNYEHLVLHEFIVDGSFTIDGRLCII